MPVTVPTADGAKRAGTIVVRTWLDGDPPGPGDHAAVAAELRRLHRYTANRAQRPGFVGTVELASGAVRGGDVDLSGLSADIVGRFRAAWSALHGPVAVVHGDPGPANVRVLAGRPGFLDWDESRVDRAVLDLDDWEPEDRTVRSALLAWEAVACRRAEPDYAAERLAEFLRSTEGEPAPPPA
ncbi:aminoglycoside phosphotransferase/kinase family protein [Pseudonocardia phyllosphaerae]|uniref:hypothetical protein n=1 Tax=Pseudonocardia phyllosphaerae TaxID=3390502 RepID=UPI00397B2AAC